MPLLLVLAARVWSPYKELFHSVENAIRRKQPDALHDLEVVIRRHKPDFISLLKNPVSISAYCTLSDCPLLCPGSQCAGIVYLFVSGQGCHSQDMCSQS